MYDLNNIHFYIKLIQVFNVKDHYNIFKIEYQQIHNKQHELNNDVELDNIIKTTTQIYGSCIRVVTYYSKQLTKFSHHLSHHEAWSTGAGEPRHFKGC